MIPVILGGLATWRLSHMISKELGPLGVFARLRAWAAENQKGIGGIYDGISCVGCVSVYIGAVASLWFVGDVFSWIVYTLVFSAIATIIEQVYVKIKS